MDNHMLKIIARSLDGQRETLMISFEDDFVAHEFTVGTIEDCIADLDALKEKLIECQNRDFIDTTPDEYEPRIGA